MQPTWLLERQHQLQPTIATRGSGGRKLPSRGASNLPRVEDLVVARWSSVILGDDQMWVRNLFVDRFRLGPLAVQGANGQEDSHERTTENHRPRSSDSSNRSWIATKRTTHLRAVGSRQTLPRNDWPNTRTSTNTARGLESVRGLDQGLEVWNRPGARSRSRRLWRFKGFKRLM